MGEYKEPTELGWYKYADGTTAGLMVFLLRNKHGWLDTEKKHYGVIGTQWSVCFDNSDYEDCDFGYIDQAGPIERIYS